MAQDEYASIAGDVSDFSSSTSVSGAVVVNHDSSSSSLHIPRSPSPQRRVSSDSTAHSASASSKWPDTATVSDNNDAATTASLLEDFTGPADTSFDENVLRTLCELDCGVPLLLDRIKQSVVSCREASSFFKKRAAMEEEYGRTLQKLARGSSEVYSMSDGKAGTFVSAWQTSMRIHETMAENRLRFAQHLNDMSEELATMVKEVEKNRKTTKDLATRYERALQESEGTTEKSKNRLDVTSEELERLLLQKEGESFKDNAVQPRAGGAGGKRAIGKAVAKGGLLLKGRNPGNLQRQEEDIRLRMSSASDAFRKAVTDTQAMRQEYFNFQLPRILRSLKECADEIDLGTQYHLTRYAFLFESVILSDGSTLAAPKDEGTRHLGLKNAVEQIDNRADFRTYMQNYAYARSGSASRGPRREGPADAGFLPPLPSHSHQANSSIPNGNGIQDTASVSTAGANGNAHPTFGVDLAEQMVRDDVELPPIVQKCCEAIEKYGMESQGIYRLSGTTSKIQALKVQLDRDLGAVDLDSPEWSSDINNVTSVLKMWFRELPDPLMTNNLQDGFIEAARIENDRLRHIRLHEKVNDLPDPNYATLKFFLGHLYRINQHESVNSMSMQNFAIVFGPTLFGPGANGVVADPTYQNLAIETILKHYTDIFVDETD